MFFGSLYSKFLIELVRITVRSGLESLFALVRITDRSRLESLFALTRITVRIGLEYAEWESVISDEQQPVVTQGKSGVFYSKSSELSKDGG